MNFKKFFVFSILIHIVFFIGFYFIPADKVKKGKEFITKLVTPQELEKPKIIPPKPKIKLPPPLPPVPGKPLPPRDVPVRQPELSPEKHLVPGEGKGAGRPLPKGADEVFGGRQGESTAKEKLSRSTPLEKPGYLENQKLFDRGVIDEIAKKGSPEKHKEDRAMTFDTSEYKYMGYMNLLRGRLESSGCWVYPRDAVEKGVYGDLLIEFTIKKNGRLGAVDLLRTSGHKSLDDAAMNAVRNCGPYWPLPEEWGMEAYTIVGHFVYTLYGAYVR